MSAVKWIKIVVDIFDDEKMLLIESLPDADSIIVCWFKLLCLAGKQNNCGVLMLNDRIAYTDEMLATVFRRPLQTVRLAMETFEQFGMIEIVNGAITIPNWEKHQSLDRLDKIRDYQRDYQRKYREKQALLTENKFDRKLYVNPLEEDIEEEIEVDKERKSTAHACGEYGWVKLTDEQYTKLEQDLGEDELLRCIRYVDESAQQTGNKNKWKDWNLVIRKCSRDGWGKTNTQTPAPAQPQQKGRNIKAACNSYPSIDLDRLNSAIDKI